MSDDNPADVTWIRTIARPLGNGAVHPPRKRTSYHAFCQLYSTRASTWP